MLIYTITPIFLILSIYLSLKIKIEYRKYQKRLLSTSTLSLLHHDSYVGLAVFSAWYSTWPIIIDNNLFFHISLYILGSILVLIGISLYIIYLACIKSVPKAIGRDSEDLITDGIFSKSRNPQSLARAIGLIGLGIMGRSYFTLFLALFWISVNHYNILSEEELLEIKFGDLYLNYCCLTPRYFQIKKKEKD